MDKIIISDPGDEHEIIERDLDLGFDYLFSFLVFNCFVVVSRGKEV